MTPMLRPCLSVFEVDVGMFKDQRGFLLWLLTLTLAWAGLFKRKC